MNGLEKGNLRQAQTLYSKEIESKTQLEQLLRQCVDDVKNEIAKKRSENKILYCNFLNVTLQTQIKRRQEERMEKCLQRMI